MTFDIIVIGKGLIGSAAAKYLSRENWKVAVIGPDEPDNYQDGLVFASHYDSGRVQRQLGRNEAMTQINLLALQEYPVLESESGIRFHRRTGCLYVNPNGIDPYLEAAEESALHHGIKIKTYSGGSAIARDFPFFRFPKTSAGMWEADPSGHINPRLLIKAQLRVVQKNKGAVMREVVERVHYEREAIAVHTTAGNTYRCKKILLATGAFSNLFHLLARPLALTLKSETVLLAQLAPAEAHQLKIMPSLLYEMDTPELEGIYATQPIQYPDGNYYLKMGANLAEDIFFKEGLPEIKNWFAHGNSDAHLPKLSKALLDLMPGLKVEKMISKRCILTRTAGTENPYIGEIEKGRSFLAIGNGYGAMNADGAGRLVAALMANGVFPEGISKKDFAPVFLDA